jgi:putative ATPase
MKPLAERMRPIDLQNYKGQKHLISEHGMISKLIESGKIPSMILWGPPGVGKTTLARLIASALKCPFHSLSAIHSGVKEIRDTILTANKSKFFDQTNVILFIDEIHRFSKSQQDSLLGAVEDGTIILIGATTENPSFEVIPALLSRCTVYQLNPLVVEDLSALMKEAFLKDEYLKSKKIELVSDEKLFLYSGGDARKLFNILELLFHSQKEEPIIISDERVLEVIQNNPSIYDKNGDMHFDTASALIKSIRGSDPNAAVYWLSRMIKGGEDIQFIGRRLIIAASEDIGLANPNALLMAYTAFQSAIVIGMPEARIILSQAAIYLAVSPKSNSSYDAISKALNEADYRVPLHLRNAPTSLMKSLGYGKDYQYPHHHSDNFAFQEYLPDEIRGTVFYEPGNNEPEEKIRISLKKKWDKKYPY